MKWRPDPAGEISGHRAHQNQESAVPAGEGGSGKRKGSHPALPLPVPLHHPPPGGAEGEEPCDRPAGRAVPLRSRCHPARI